MRLLLDTHVLFWLARETFRIPNEIRAALNDAKARYLSPVSAMEISLKSGRGRMPGGDSVIAGWALVRRRLFAQDTELRVEHMARAGSLDWPHRDPFDRILVAQSQIEGLTLVTQDRALVDYPEVDTLTW